jgi:hypothetical protein
LLNPSYDGEALATSKPEFFGRGPKGLQLNITVKSPGTVNGNIMVNDNGKWNFPAPSDLTPGSHTIVLEWVDANGISQILTKQFQVQALAGELAFTASPSAAPIFELSPTPTNRLTPIPTPTEPVRRIIPSPSTGIPQSGILTPTIFFFIMGILSIFAGIFFIRRSAWT